MVCKVCLRICFLGNLCKNKHHVKILRWRHGFSTPWRCSGLCHEFIGTLQDIWKFQGKQWSASVRYHANYQLQVFDGFNSISCYIFSMTLLWQSWFFSGWSDMKLSRPPTPVLLPGKFHGWRSLVGCSPWSHKESDTTEWLHFHFSLSCTGEGNGNPLQCSCLENPRDRGAWWAAVYGVAQSRTLLKWLSSSSSV